MKLKLAVPLFVFLAAMLVPFTPARADDAATKKQLVGTWKRSDNQTVVLKADGGMTSDMPGKQTWDVRKGVFHTKFKDNEDFYKILSLTKTKFVFQDLYYGQHTGQWKRVGGGK